MSAQVAQDLRAAADVLERDGWTQGAFTAEDGSHCAVGAICEVHNWNLNFSRNAILAMQEWLNVRPLQDWNDAPGRTAAEVIAALRAAADRAEAAS